MQDTDNLKFFKLDEIANNIEHVKKVEPSKNFYFKMFSVVISICSILSFIGLVINTP